MELVYVLITAWHELNSSFGVQINIIVLQMLQLTDAAAWSAMQASCSSPR